MLSSRSRLLPLSRASDAAAREKQHYVTREPAASWQSELRHDEIRDQPPPPRYPGGGGVDCCRREDATLLFSSNTTSPALSSSCRLSAGLANLLPATRRPPRKEIKNGKKKKTIQSAASSSIGEVSISGAEETPLKGGAEIDAHVQKKHPVVFVVRSQCIQKNHQIKKSYCGSWSWSPVCLFLTNSEHPQIQTGELYLYFLKQRIAEVLCSLL